MTRMQVRSNTDFSDALGDRRIEEIQPPRFAGASPRTRRWQPNRFWTLTATRWKSAPCTAAST
ncbi:hypothetical protein IPC432_13010 [Pseudomonas aeruginosa]|nr:hypothetical protein IPC432_13010 [Pseudomonas aeruginosa]